MESTHLSHSCTCIIEREIGKHFFFFQQFFGHPRSKSGSGWLPLPFSFTMSHQEKNNEIHKIFSQLPGKERLIDG